MNHKNQMLSLVLAGALLGCINAWIVHLALEKWEKYAILGNKIK